MTKHCAARERSAHPVLGLPGYVRVVIGGRTEIIKAGMNEVQATLRKLHRHPSPVIWRALGVSA